MSLKDIIRNTSPIAFPGLFGDWQFTTFNQRFQDECAGVFCSVALQVPAGTVCEEGYFDFNDDFNDDFATATIY